MHPRVGSIDTQIGKITVRYLLGSNVQEEEEKIISINLKHMVESSLN